MRKKTAIYVIVLSVCLMITPARADISPTAIEVSLKPGESIYETKTVTITEVIPKADIIFAFDLTISMGEELGQAQANAIYIMEDLDKLISDARYGVMSFMDYDGNHNSCGYSHPVGYGDASWGDYPYSLDQNITDDRSAVANAINALEIGWGVDTPENYTRIMYESYADTSIGYRAGSRKILILFGDAIPHDCDLNEGVPGKTGICSTGKDPGRDGVVGTPDDLDLQTVLGEMAANNVTLLYVQGASHNPDDALDYWNYWTGLTGGAAYQLTTAMASDIPDAIYELIEAEVIHLDELTLEVTTPDYENWFTSVDPPSYTNIDIEGTMDFIFDIIITVPEDACEEVKEGEVIHKFVVSAMGDGASYGDQEVAVDVACEVGEDPSVYIDIKPGSCPNPLNVRSKGVLPVAVLGTEDFDVTTVDPATIKLAGVAPLRWAYEDVATPFEEELCGCHDLNGDGYMDLTLKFKKQEVVETLEVKEVAEEIIPLTLTANLKEEDGGVPITGEDCVWILR